MSNFLGALALTVGLNNSMYTDQSEPEYTYKVSLAHDALPVYIWGGYEELSIRTLGQALGDSSIIGVGLGAKKSIGDFYIFGEIGYGIVDQNENLQIQQEMVYTELVHNHESEYRPVPVTVNHNYDQDSYETLWEVDNGVMGRLGVGYELVGGLNVTLAYRPFYVKERMELWDEARRASEGGWWQESRTRNLSSFEVGIAYEF
jgi:hypothetical protein